MECLKLESLRMEQYMNHFRPCRLCWNKLVLVVVVAIALCWSQKKGEVTLIIMRPWSAGVVCSWFSRSSSCSRLRPRHRCDRWLSVSCETEKIIIGIITKQLCAWKSPYALRVTIDDLRKSRGLHSVSAYGQGPVYIGPCLRV